MFWPQADAVTITGSTNSAQLTLTGAHKLTVSGAEFFVLTGRSIV